MKPDNNLDRVTNKARQYDAVLYWQAINTQTGRLTYVDEIDLPEFERANNVGLTWMLSPILDRNVVDYNGNPL